MTEDNLLAGLRQFLVYPDDCYRTQADFLQAVALRIKTAVEYGTYRGGPYWDPLRDAEQKRGDLVDEARNTEAKNREVLALLNRPIRRKAQGASSGPVLGTDNSNSVEFGNPAGN